MLILSINCKTTETDQEIVFSLEDFRLIGWKPKGNFETVFPEAIDAKWGYIKGSEVGVIIYLSSEIADIEGDKAGSDQTEFLEENPATSKDSGDTGSFFGPKVEKTGCRGFDKVTLFRGECPRREPLYTVYKVDNNALVLIEPLRDENQDLAQVRLDKLIDQLKFNFE